MKYFCIHFSLVFPRLIAIISCQLSECAFFVAIKLFKLCLESFQPLLLRLFLTLFLLSFIVLQFFSIFQLVCKFTILLIIMRNFIFWQLLSFIVSLFFSTFQLAFQLIVIILQIIMRSFIFWQPFWFSFQVSIFFISFHYDLNAKVCQMILRMMLLLRSLMVFLQLLACSFHSLSRFIIIFQVAKTYFQPMYLYFQNGSQPFLLQGLIFQYFSSGVWTVIKFHLQISFLVFYFFILRFLALFLLLTLIFLQQQAFFLCSITQYFYPSGRMTQLSLSNPYQSIDYDLVPILVNFTYVSLSVYSRSKPILTLFIKIVIQVKQLLPQKA